jgi:hypothetical protein
MLDCANARVNDINLFLCPWKCHKNPVGGRKIFVLVCISAPIAFLPRQQMRPASFIVWFA